MTNQGNLNEYHRTQFLNPLVSAMDDEGYKLYVMCIPKDETQDLPILPNRVMQCLLSSYGLNITDTTFPLWHKKFKVQDFDPLIQLTKHHG